ncbi:TonB family protein [bacterium]|nr:TonB family protein [bacterium]
MNRSLSFSISLAAHTACVGFLLLTGKPGRDEPIIVQPCRVTLFAAHAATPSPARSAPKVKAPTRRPTPPKVRPEPEKPVFVTRKSPRRKPPAPVKPSYDFQEITKVEREALPEFSPRTIRRNPGVSQVSVPAGVASSFDAQIASFIKSNWVRPSRAVLGEDPPTVSVAIRIAIDGRITRKRITGASGIGLLDASAVKAIERSNPLPIGLPTYMGHRHYDVTIVFRIADEA